MNNPGAALSAPLWSCGFQRMLLRRFVTVTWRRPIGCYAIPAPCEAQTRWRRQASRIRLAGSRSGSENESTREPAAGGESQRARQDSNL